MRTRHKLYPENSVNVKYGEKTKKFPLPIDNKKKLCYILLEVSQG